MAERKNIRAFTFVEVCMSVLILSLVFGVGAVVMSYARKETQKGFWIQQSIGQLRNATRQIGIKMKEMSYPSTLVRNYTNTNPPKLIVKVIPFKEKRTYDNAGCLRNITINPSDAYELRAKANQGLILPSDKPQVLMYFPISEPEKDYSSGYTAGLITWVRFIFEPSKDYSITKLGSIFMEEYESEYDTRVKPDRAYNLDEPFSEKSSKLKRRNELIIDVSGVEISSYDVSTVRGIAYKKDGSGGNAVMNVKNIISFKIWCKHPKDNRIVLNDMCSVTSNTEVKPL
jgi:hypothetical protein